MSDSVYDVGDVSDASWDQDTLDADELDIPADSEIQIESEERDEGGTVSDHPGRSADELWTDLGLDDIAEVTQATEPSQRAQENANHRGA
jgi:hypothetical protein